MDLPYVQTARRRMPGSLCITGLSWITGKKRPGEPGLKAQHAIACCDGILGGILKGGRALPPGREVYE